MTEKFRNKVSTEIILEPGVDPHKVGEHFAALHDMRVQPAYRNDLIRENVETTYKVTKNKAGRDVVEIIEIHK